MKNFKSMRFNKETITVTYEEGSDVSAIVDWLFYNHELKNVVVDENSFTFSYKGLRHLWHAMMDFMTKTCGCVRTDKWIRDDCTEHLRLITNEGKLFQVTLFNERGTIGNIESGFGCWQFGRILTIHGVKGGVGLELFNSFLDEVSHDLLFEEDCDYEILIEIGDIQF